MVRLKKTIKPLIQDSLCPIHGSKLTVFFNKKFVEEFMTLLSLRCLIYYEKTMRNYKWVITKFNDSVPCSINCGNIGVKERIKLKGILKELTVKVKCTDWILLAHDCPVHMVMNPLVSQKVGNFLTNNRVSMTISRRDLMEEDFFCT